MKGTRAAGCDGWLALIRQLKGTAVKRFTAESSSGILAISRSIGRAVKGGGKGVRIRVETRVLGGCDWVRLGGELHERYDLG